MLPTPNIREYIGIYGNISEYLWILIQKSRFWGPGLIPLDWDQNYVQNAGSFTPVALMGIWEASGRHLRRIWEASGGTWETSGGTWEASGGTWEDLEASGRSWLKKLDSLSNGIHYYQKNINFTVRFWRSVLKHTVLCFAIAVLDFFTTASNGMHVFKP